MNGVFEVIKGTKGQESKAESKEERLERIYLNAISREIKTIVTYDDWNECKDDIKHLAYYAIKYYGLPIVHRKYCKELRTYDDVQRDYQLLESIKMFIGLLTPRELMIRFPITKEYDGYKYECKDYWYTVEQLKKYDMDVPLGQSDRLEEFLWDYWNDDLFAFHSTEISIMSNMYEVRTGKGIMEEFMVENNIPSYSYNEDYGIMQNNQTGEIFKVSKKSNLHVVK